MVTTNIHQAMALSMHVLTHGMIYSEKTIRQDRSHDLPSNVSTSCGNSTTNGGCGGSGSGGQHHSELPRRLSHESSRDSIDKSPDLPARNPSHHEAASVPEGGASGEGGSSDPSCDAKGSDDVKDANMLYPKCNPLQNGSLQWWMIEKSAIKVRAKVICRYKGHLGGSRVILGVQRSSGQSAKVTRLVQMSPR